MILADTSVWIEHIRRGDRVLTAALEADEVLIHPFVIGELAMGNLAQRDIMLAALADLPRAVTADHDEVLAFVAREALHSRGVGYVDAHLLASVRLSPDARLFSRDRRLQEAAEQLGLG